MGGYVPSLVALRKHLLRDLSVLCGSDENHYTEEQVRPHCAPFS